MRRMALIIIIIISLHRCEMLASIRDSLPELYPVCYSAYSRPSILFFGSHIIESQEGPQQGDPLDPLLFCNTIQPLLDSLRSTLTLGYLDDVTLGGPKMRLGLMSAVSLRSDNL